MQRLYSLLLCLLLGVIAVFSQSGFSVESFKMEPNDQDARINHSINDWNGNRCAIIKVVTSQRGFKFENGQLGVVEAIHKPELSEHWVYVPEGTIKLKITHPHFGQLETETNDGFYHFESVKAATVYRLVLNTPQVDELELMDQYGFLLFETQPEGAQLTLFYHGAEVFSGKTMVQEELHYGEYTYTLSLPGYLSESGRVVIDREHVDVMKVMKPLVNPTMVDSSQVHGRLRIVTYPPRAEIKVNDVSFGNSPMPARSIPVGEYDVTLSLRGYETVSRHIAIAKDSLVEIRVDLTPLKESENFGVNTQYPNEEFEKFRAELEQEEIEKQRIEFEERKKKEEQELAEAKRKAEEKKAEAQRRIEEAQRKAERLKLLSTPIQSRFESIVQVGYTGVPVQIKGVSEYFGMAMLEINYIAGWRFNNTLFLGAGIGGSFDFSDHDDCIYFRPAMQTEEQTYVDGSPWQFPLFAHMRAYLTGGKPVQFFFSLSAGYIFEPDSRVIIYHNNIPESQYSNYNGGGFFVAPGLGINIRLSSKVGFDISASYQGRWQKAVYYYPDNMYENKWLSGVNINLGLTF